MNECFCDVFERPAFIKANYITQQVGSVMNCNELLLQLLNINKLVCDCGTLGLASAVTFSNNIENQKLNINKMRNFIIDNISFFHRNIWAGE